MFTRLVCLSLTALFVLTSSVSANEALLTESSGSLALMDGSSTNIHMVSEEVIIELGIDSYTVDATFEFMNEGETVTVPVGFPDAGYGYLYAFRGVKTNETFETWVNGEPCSFRDMPGRMVLNAQDIVIADSDSLDMLHGRLANNEPPLDDVNVYFAEELRWLVKEVSFPGGKTTTTRVRYTAEYANMMYAEYIYGTGQSWKGSIGTARFVIRTSPEVWMLKVPTFSPGFQDGRTWVGERAGEFEHVYTLTNLEPEEDEVMRVFVLTDGSWPEKEPWQDHGDFIYANKPVDNEFLDILSLDQLRDFRFTVYAAHGRIFDDPELDSYFRSRLWYKPRADFTEADLTAIDCENIRRIEAKEEWLRESW